jgi:CO/xanthine dehydrogenase Mo-binding subunit
MVSRQPCIELFDGDGSVLSLRDLFREFGEDLEVVGQYAPPLGIPLDENGQGSPYAFHTFGVQCAKVLVNILTGKVTVQKIVAIYDVGTPINPALVLVQMEGGIAMGIGYALTEEIQLKDGRVLNPNFDLYMIPTSMDIATVQFVNVPLADEAFPFGAKGIGEPSCIPTAAAIANAVAEAAGVDFFRLPINLEEVISGVTKRG